jgi:hypothetical protein
MLALAQLLSECSQLLSTAIHLIFAIKKVTIASTYQRLCILLSFDDTSPVMFREVGKLTNPATDILLLGIQSNQASFLDALRCATSSHARCE